MLTPPSNETFLKLATPQERIDVVVTHLTEGPLDDGGYPYDYEWFGSTLVVAELDDDGATKIDKRRDLLRWHRLAARFLRENEGEDYDVKSAFHETRSRALSDEQPAAERQWQAEEKAFAKAKRETTRRRKAEAAMPAQQREELQRERRERLRKELRPLRSGTGQ
jgi:hypothetical protein